MLSLYQFTIKSFHGHTVHVSYFVQNLFHLDCRPGSCYCLFNRINSTFCRAIPSIFLWLWLLLLSTIKTITYFMITNDELCVRCVIVIERGRNWVKRTKMWKMGKNVYSTTIIRRTTKLFPFVIQHQGGKYRTLSWSNWAKIRVFSIDRSVRKCKKGCCC